MSKDSDTTETPEVQAASSAPTDGKVEQESDFRKSARKLQEYLRYKLYGGMCAGGVAAGRARVT
jgi:hypothetical protein